jgi:phage shock protein A
MSIFSRFRDIIKSNLHAAADKIENPEYILDAKYDDLLHERKRIEQGVRDSIAHRIMIQNEMEDLRKKIGKVFEQAKLHRLKALSLEEKAKEDPKTQVQLEKHNGEALKRLQDKMRMEEKLGEFQEKFQKAELRINAMKEKQIALQAKLEDLRTRKEEIKSELRMAEAERRISSALSGLDGDFGDVDLTIQRIEDKVKRTKALAEATTEMALEMGRARGDVIEIEGVAELRAESALKKLDIELLGEGQIERLAPGEIDFFTIEVSGGGTWAFQANEKKELLASLNQIDKEMTRLKEKNELDHDGFEENYKKIFQIIRKRGKLVGRDIKMSAVAGDKVTAEPAIRIPPEDLEYSEAIKLLEGEGLIAD